MFSCCRRHRCSSSGSIMHGYHAILWQECSVVLTHPRLGCVANAADISDDDVRRAQRQSCGFAGRGSRLAEWDGVSRWHKKAIPKRRVMHALEVSAKKMSTA